jgi:hypothetical protein
MKITRCGLGILALLAVAVVPVRGQQTAPAASNGNTATSDAAKKSGDEKPKRARVWDNDNIPKAGDEISVVGQTSSATQDGSGGTGVGAAAIASNPDEKKIDRIEAEPKADRDARLEAAKAKVDSLKKDLDLLQRNLDLDSQMYFSKPDYASDKDGAQKIKDEHDGVQAKQDEVDAAQKELDELQAALNK